MPGGEQPDVFRSKGVDVLERRDCLDNLPFVDLRRKGELDQDAENRGVIIQPVDEAEQVGLRGPVRQFMQPTLKARLLSRFALVANVEPAGRAITYHNRGQ